MLPAICRRLGYGWLLVQGLLAAVAPRLSIRLNLKVAGMGFENVGEVEPRDWYVRAARATGVGMIVTGLTGLLLEGRASDREATVDEDRAPVEVDVPGSSDTPDSDDEDA